jgi:hypothetical protein
MKSVFLIAIVAVAIIGVISLTSINVLAQSNSNIPEWIKNNAGWWAEGTIDDDSFVNGIKFLIETDVMEINTADSAKKHITSNRSLTEYTDRGDFYITYKPNSNSMYKGDDTAIAWLKNSELLENEVLWLNDNLRLPYDIEIVAKECGETNAYYFNTKIIICYELVDAIFVEYAESEIADLDHIGFYAESVIYFIFYHELGHALIDVYDLPFTGLEENVADQFGALMTIHNGDIGQDMIYDVGTWFLVNDFMVEKYDGYYTYADYADTHGFDLQRFSNISCYAYGHNADYNQDLINDGWLPEDRAEYCYYEYDDAVNGWYNLLKDFDNGFFDV